MAATNGISNSPDASPVRRIESNSPAAGMQYLDDRTDLGTVREDDLQSFEFVIVELVRIIRRLEFGTVR